LSTVPDEAEVLEYVASRIRTSFYLGLGLGLMFGFWTTVLGMWLAWAVWQWWLA
jgi:hypothetical protein